MLAAFAVGLENGLAMNFLTSPRLAKKQAAKHAAEIKPIKMQTIGRLKRKARRNVAAEAARRTNVERLLATLNKTKKIPPYTATIRINETIKLPRGITSLSHANFMPSTSKNECNIMILYF